MPAILSPQVLLFDFYGTLVDIHTTERSRTVWHQLARFLCYRGLPAEARTLRHTFFSLLRHSRRYSDEQHPEWEARQLFGTLLRDLGYSGRDDFVVEVAQLFRVLTMRRFGCFPDTLPILQRLAGRYRLGLLSDAQRLFLEPELAEAGLSGFFETVVVSSDYGYRKPDTRLFRHALASYGVAPQQARFIGDNLLRDVGGAQAAGIPAIWLARPGASTEEAATRPHWTISTLHDLLPLLAD